MWFKLVKRRKVKVRRVRRSSVTKHYLAHKEKVRGLIHARLQHYNQHYIFTYGRVAIRNQKTRWGSCSSLGNLNFSYKILFLPTHLQDYIIVHELCHLQHLNHGRAFWELVAQQIPEYKKCVAELRKINHKELK